MHCHCAGDKGMKIVHRQVKHRTLASRTPFYHLECERWSGKRFLLYAVVLRGLRVRAREQGRKPLARSDLAEQFNGRRKITGIPVQWLELARGRLRQTRKAIVALQKRVVRENDWLAFHQFHTRSLARL